MKGMASSAGAPYLYWSDELPTAADLAPTGSIARRRKLLAEAGHPNGFETTLFYYEYFPQMTSQIQLVQQDLKRNLNIELKITKQDYTTYFGRYAEGKWEGTAWGFQTGYAISLDERTYQYMHSKSPKNYFRVNDPVIDELCTQLRQTPDRAEQRAIARKVVAREHDQVLRMWMPLTLASNYGSRTCATSVSWTCAGTLGTGPRPWRVPGSTSEGEPPGMYKYVMRRLLLVIPVLVLSSLVVFGLMRVMPGDALTALMAESGNVSPRELQKLRKDLGLDRPYHEQYLLWIWQLVTFNPGYSIFTGDAISVSLKKSIPVTIELAALAIAFGLLIAIPVGVLSATRQDKPADYIGRLVAVSGLSFPDFWLGTLVITFAAIWFNWIPPLGYTSVWESLEEYPAIPAAGGDSGVPPFLCHHADDALHPPGGVARGLRADCLGQGPGRAYHHLQARAEKRPDPGGHHRGRAIGRLLAGTVIIETIFALPGMGRLTVEAIIYRDYPVVQTNVMLVATVLVTLNLLVDLTYAWLDPRIRYQ